MPQPYIITEPKPTAENPGTWECSITLRGTPLYTVLGWTNPEAAASEALRLIDWLQANETPP